MRLKDVLSESTKEDRDLLKVALEKRFGNRFLVWDHSDPYGVSVNEHTSGDKFASLDVYKKVEMEIKQKQVLDDLKLKSHVKFSRGRDDNCIRMFLR